MFGIAEKEIAPRLEIAHYSAEETILGIVIEVDEGIAEKDDIEEALERPLDVVQINASEFHEPGDNRLYFHLPQHAIFAAEEVFPYEWRCSASQRIHAIDCALGGFQDLGVDVGCDDFNLPRDGGRGES